MWTLFKFFGHILKALFWITLLIACGVIILLYVLENGLPEPVVRRVCEKLSSKDVIIEIDRITYTPKSGLHLHVISAEPRKLASESFGTAEDIIIEASLSPFIDHYSRIRSITLKGIDMPRHPRRIFRKLKKLKDKEGEKKPDKPRKKLPTLAPFRVTVEDSNVIGLKVEKTSAMATIREPVIKFSDMTLKWPDTTYNMQIKGSIIVDLDAELLDGKAKGEAFPDNLTDFLKELDANSVIEEIDLFSGIKSPIEATSNFTVDLNKGDFSIDVDLDVKECAYRKVPLIFVRGYLQAWGTNNLTWVKVSNLSAANESGRVEGNLFYDEENSSIKLQATSTMDHNEVLTIIDILTHGELHPLKPIHPPSVTAKGIVSIKADGPLKHNLSGRIVVGEGEVFGLQMKEASSHFRVQGDHAYLDDVKGTTPSGGNVSGDADFTIPLESDDPPFILANVKVKKIDLSDLARIFNITNAKAGECSGDMQISGILGTNQLHTLNGNGHFRIKNGRLNRLPLFAGLTDYLTKNIPGISSIVDQSDCHMNFMINDGLLSSKDFTIEGDVFSVQGKGTYDIAKDDLKFTVHVALFRKKTIAGTISRIVTFPFKKLLLEFKVFGSIDNPDWSYVNILEKINDQIPEKK